MKQKLYNKKLQRDTGYINVTSSINRITITQKIIIRQTQVGMGLKKRQRKAEIYKPNGYATVQ